MSRKILGIDICTHALSAVLLEAGLRDAAVDSCMFLKLPENKDFHDALAETLPKITAHMDVDKASCMAAFPPERISYRNLKLPFKNSRKIRQVLPFELELLLPFAMQEMALSHLHLPADGDANILAAAVVRSELQGFTGLLAEHALDPASVSPAGCALAVQLAAVEGMPPDWLLLDISPQTGTLFITAGGNLRLIRAFPLSHGDLPAGKTIAAAVRRTVAAFEDRSATDFTPRQVLLTGSGLYDLNLETELAERLDVPVSRADLLKQSAARFAAKSVDGWVPYQMDKALALAMAGAGMGKRELLNFRPRGAAQSRFWQQNRKPLTVTAALAAILLILLATQAVMKTRVLRQRLDHLDQQITTIFKATFPDVRRIVDPLQQMRVKLRDIDRGPLLSTGNPVRALEILNDISRRIPARIDVTFSRLVISSQAVQISAVTDTFNTVDEIKNRLIQSNIFEKVDITSANLDKSGKHVRFKLRLQFPQKS